MEVNRYETFALPIGQTGVGVYPKCPVRSNVKAPNPGSRKSACDTISQKAGAVKAIQAVGGSNPEKAGVILGQRTDGGVPQSFLMRIALEGVPLRVQRISQTDQRRETEDSLAIPA